MAANLSPNQDDASGQEGDALRLENAELRLRLQEAEETLAAIRQGDVDALVVGNDVYTLDSSNAAANKMRQDVLAQMEDAVLAFDPQDHLTFMNAAAERHYGLQASATLGRAKASLFEEIWPDAETRAASVSQLQAQGAYRGNVVHRLLHDGSHAHVEVSISLLRDAAGKPSGQLYVIRNIDERIEAERSLAATTAALARRERQFSTLVENSPFIFARLDRAYRHVYVSPIVTRYTGREASEYLGRTNAELGVPAELCEQWAQALDHVFESGAPGRVKYGFMAVEGGHRVFDARLIPEFDDAGQVESVLSIAVDVTEQERINAALQESQARLQEADARKDEFLATLAHELRNPLAPIRNALEIMQLSDVPARHAEARKIVQRQLAQLVHLVDDLLDVSRISRGKLELRLELADMAGVIQAAIETSRPLIEAGRHELTTQLPLPRSLMVEADVTRLCQVVANLLNNAAKYTPEGGRIEVVAQRQGDSAVVTVRDTGVGIAPDMLPRVFDLFTQVERESVRAQGGLGIGLALVRQLVGMHGGKVEAHSDGPGKGSEFVLQLPLTNRAAEASEGSAATKWRAGPAGTRVLVVDDNIDSAVTLATLLEILGYQTATAHDGGEAVRQAESFAPHVAVLDLGLPVMSGYDAARRIRSSAWGQDMLLVALSGWGQAVDRRKSAEAGFDHHFVKPVDLDALTQVLATVRSPGGRE
jgi:PAS domain S-box-containing protein